MENIKSQNSQRVTDNSCFVLYLVKTLFREMYFLLNTPRNQPPCLDRDSSCSGSFDTWTLSFSPLLDSHREDRKPPEQKKQTKGREAQEMFNVVQSLRFGRLYEYF